MSRHGIQKKPIVPTIPPTETSITPVAAGTDGVAPASGGRGRWLVLAAVAALGVGLAVWAASNFHAGSFSSSSEDLVKRFVRLRTEGKAAQDLLGPPPVFDEDVVSEAEAERRWADFCLRSSLTLVKVLPGEPDGTKQRPVKNRFTLLTKGDVRTPRLLTRTETGGQSLDSYQLINPDVIVEVRDGRIHGVRTGLPVR